VPETETNRLPFTAILLERDGRFFLYEPGLGVISSAESVEGAYEKFADARRAYVAEVERAGLTAEKPARRSSAVAVGQSASRELTLFAGKVGIVLLVIAAIGTPVVVSLSRSIGQVAAAVSEIVAPLKSISLADVSRKAADIARDAQDLSADKKETLRQSVGVISREAAPIIDAWRNPP
jgi:hypothetical protein